MTTTQRHLLLLGVLTLLSATGVACSSADCRDVGCDRNQLCNEETGECATSTPATSCTVTGCPPDQSCDSISGECVERATFCRPFSDDACVADPACSICPEGLVCDVTNGFCISNDACLFTSCSIDNTCDPNTGQCVLIPCTIDEGGCPAGTTCSQMELFCVQGCRADGDCRDDQRCDLSGSELGSCVTVCQADTDCDWGSRCMLRAGQGLCEPEGPCESDDMCREGESCRSGQCQRAFCSDDGSCLEGEYCQFDTGQCLPDTCEEDTSEPNDTAEQASRFLRGSALLALCRNDREDWFTYTHDDDDDQQLTIDLLYDIAVADLDLEVYQGDRLLAASATPEYNETIRLPTTLRGKIDIRVHVVRGSDARYQLTLSTQEPTCEEDASEPNDTVAQAASRAVDDPATALTTCADDRDLLRILPQSGGGSLTIELQLEEPNTDPGPDVWSTSFSADGVTWTPIVPDEEGRRRLPLAWVGPEQRPYLSSTSTEPVTWIPVLTATDGFDVLCDDPRPGHTTFDTAAELGLSPTAPAAADGTLCPDVSRSPVAFERDWYSLQLPEGTFTVQVTLREGPSGLDDMPLQLTQADLRTGDDALPWRTSNALTSPMTNTTTDSTLVASISRVDRPVWLTVGTNILPGLLHQWPDYALEVALEPVSAETCIQDRSEGLGNDTPETATALSAEHPLDAILCPDERDLLLLDLRDLDTTETLSQLFILARDADVHYRITLNDPTLEPILQGTLSPMPEQDGSGEGDGDGGDDEPYPSPNPILNVDTLPSDAELLWLELTPGPGTSTEGAVYSVAIEAP